MTGFDIDGYLARRRTEIDELLAARLPARETGDDPGRLVEAVRYSLLAPGKRLRPVLALAAAEAVGARLTVPIRIAASATELVHGYSLVHDDLPCMDDDDFRRGQPTSHKVFGEAVAVLAGDAMLTLAFEWLAEATHLANSEKEAGTRGNYVRAISALAKGAGMWGMVRGQARDIAESAPNTLAGLEILHREKTAALFRAAVEVGAAVAGGSDQQIEALGRFGDQYGVAFQYADDLQDEEHSAFGTSARARMTSLLANAQTALATFDERAEPLRALAQKLGTLA